MAAFTAARQLQTPKLFVGSNDWLEWRGADLRAETIYLTGNEWQEWADQLLGRRYGPAQYQKVPSRDRGDAGIEGFAVCGHAYQCYGCEEPLGTEQRFEKQRDKMTTDIGKFIRNREKLARLFGTLKISRWCLFVPRFDGQRIVAHAAIKTNEVLNAGLPYVAEGFRVMVNDETEFSVERSVLWEQRPRALEIEIEHAEPAEVENWSSTNDRLVQVMDDKVSRLPTIASLDRAIEFRDEFVKLYLDGQNALQALREYQPIIYEKVVGLKTQKERSLRMASLLAAGPPQSLINNTIAAMVKALSEGEFNLSPSLAETLAYEAVADWLLRCPLDFPEQNNGAHNA